MTDKKKPKKIDPLETLVNELFTPEEIENFQTFFETFNLATKKEPQPKMNIKDLGVALRSLRLYPTEAELLDMEEEMDPNHTGFLGFFPLLILIHRKMETTDENEIFEAFKVFDEDQDGIVALEELKKGLCKVGEKLTYLEWKEFEKQSIKLAGVPEQEGIFDYNTFITKLTVEPKKKKGKGKKK